ncbi:MAG: DedA family protein [Planctomycetota bacterium]|nr:DedA family protein [Planctomycetota bacterium]MEE2894225.1 DedA family protein [Planctomycetota bacterium]
MLAHLDEFVRHLLIGYGPLAVFALLALAGVGVQVPEDMIVTPAGWLAAEGSMPFWTTAMAAWAGVIAADTIWFALSRRFGWSLMRWRWFKRTIHPKRILQVKWLFDRHGAKLLIISRAIPGARTPAITVAGLTRLRWGPFMVVEPIGAAFSVGVQFGLGVAAQRGLASASGPAHWWTIGIGIGVCLAVVAVGAWFWRWSKRTGWHPPRAKARWLRLGRSGG